MNRQSQKQLARSGKPHTVLHVLGAAGAVTGSMNLVEYTEKGHTTRFLLDVGLTVENESVDFQNRLPHGVKASDIDFVIISHAHLDHSGYLPRLIKLGFTGRAYATEATRDLLEFMLADAGFLQEEAARKFNEREVRAANEGRASRKSAEKKEAGTAKTKSAGKKKAADNKKSSGKKKSADENRDAGQSDVSVGNEQKPRLRKREPLYTRDEAVASISSITVLDYHQRYELAPGIAVTLTDAGHILGAAVVNLEIGNGADKRRFCFTGNIGRPDMAIVRAPDPLLPCDYFMSEATYGDRVHANRNRLDVLAGIINSAYERAKRRNGVIVIPAFAVGRAQALLYDLRELMAEKRIPSVPVFVDGPMANRSTAVHRKHKELFNDAAAKLVEDGVDPFSTPRYKECMSREESEALHAVQTEPVIIVGSSGMAHGGRIVRHLQRRLPHAENTIVFVGYQGTGTLGQALVGCHIDPNSTCATEVRIFGQVVPVRAKVEFMSDYSGHGDCEELVAMMEKLERKPKLSFVVHGSQHALLGMQERMTKRLEWKTVIPKPRETFVLS